MDNLIKIITILSIIFLAACNGDNTVLGKRESKVEKFLTTQTKQKNNYTIERASNGIYIYTDKSQEQSNEPIIPDIITN